MDIFNDLAIQLNDTFPLCSGLFKSFNDPSGVLYFVLCRCKYSMDDLQLGRMNNSFLLSLFLFVLFFNLR